jgi:uncharacterized DUF497 family protein
MPKISWNQEKNKLLKKTRGVSFEQIRKAIASGKVIKVLPHPNPTKYKNQKIMVININNYAYSVPFIEKEDQLFLKTIYANRKYTKKYLKKETK